MYYYCLPFSLGTCQNNKFLSKSRNSISIYVRCSNRLNLDLEWQHPASQKRCNLFHLSQITIRGKSATTSTDAMKERKREREREKEREREVLRQKMNLDSRQLTPTKRKLILPSPTYVVAVQDSVTR